MAPVDTLTTTPALSGNVWLCVVDVFMRVGVRVVVWVCGVCACLVGEYMTQKMFRNHVGGADQYSFQLYREEYTD